jgi:hypothetical protein
MGAPQPDRNARAQAWASGACNRGFVSLDPERQAEATDDGGRRSSKVPKRDQFAFMVQQLAEAARRRRERERSTAAAEGADAQHEQRPER